MRHINSQKKSTSFSFALFAIILLFISCGTYQSVYTDDGIYDSDNNDPKDEVVIIKNRKQAKDVESNYFKNELDRIENIEDEDVFTDVDDYTTLAKLLAP